MARKEKDTFGRFMTLNYMAVLFLLAVLTLGAFAILRNGIKTLETDSAVINVAGRQRMLSQRISHLYLHLISVQDKAERESLLKDVANAINLMGQSHQALLKGSKLMGLPGNPSAEVWAMYFSPPLSLDKKIHEFINYSRTVLYSKGAQFTTDNPSLKYIISASHEELLNALDKVVKQYEKEARARIAGLQSVEAFLMVTLICVLALMGIFVFRPLTFRIRSAYARLSESEEKYRTLVENMPDCVCIIDLDGEIISMNKAGVLIEGFKKPEDALGYRRTDHVVVKNRREFEEAMRRAIAGEVTSVQYKAVNQKGKEIWWDSTITPLRDAQGNIASLLRVSRDISERKRFDDILAKMNEFNVTLLRAIPFGMDIVDEEANILYANSIFKKMVGFDPVGRKRHVVCKEDKQQCNYCSLTNAIAVGEVKYLETAAVFGARTFRIGHIGMIYEGRKAVLEIFEDITTQKEAQQRLLEAIAVKTEFVSVVSHELRTPLTAIKESISIVADESTGALNNEQKNFLNIAQRNVMRLARFINNVLDYQKLDSGRMEFSIIPNDINAVTREVGADLNLHARNKGLDFKLELGADLPTASFDRDKISQVLYNLVYNAIKFTQKGFVCVRTEKTEDAIRVSVQDTGIGIKKEDSSKLFRDFSQLAVGKERLTGSTGLGLAISRKLVNYHGGQIWFDSEFGRGSTFYFTLPVR